MKRIILSFLFCLSFVLVASATPLEDKLWSRAEFQQKQREYITKEANLSANQATAFFTLYNELREAKRENNHKIGELMKKSKQQLSEVEYGKLLDEIYQLRENNAELDVLYNKKYKEVISSKQIFDILRAESKFNRQMIRGMNHEKRNNNKRSGR